MLHESVPSLTVNWYEAGDVPTTHVAPDELTVNVTVLPTATVPVGPELMTAVPVLPVPVQPVLPVQSGLGLLIVAARFNTAVASLDLPAEDT
jgi:hypothetical protein